MDMIKRNAGSVAVASLLGAVGVLVACGGGGDDDAGSVATFSIQPTTVTFTVPTDASGVCFGGASQDVFVYGGTAPYRVDNTVPDYVSVNTTQVDSRGGHFTVTTNGGCLKNGTIVVVDKLDHQVVFTVNNSASGSSS